MDRTDWIEQTYGRYGRFNQKIKPIDPVLLSGKPRYSLREGYANDSAQRSQVVAIAPLLVPDAVSGGAVLRHTRGMANMIGEIVGDRW